MVAPNDPPRGAPGVARGAADPGAPCASPRCGTRQMLATIADSMVLPIGPPLNPASPLGCKKQPDRLLQHVRDFGQPGSGAGVIRLLAGPRTAHSSYRVTADLDRDSSAEGEDVLHVPLRQQAGIARRPLLELHRRHTKHPGRVGLATRHLGHLRRALLVAEDDQHLARAVYDGGRGVEAFRLALGESRLGDRLREREREVALGDEPLSRGRRTRRSGDRRFRRKPWQPETYVPSGDILPPSSWGLT